MPIANNYLDIVNIKSGKTTTLDPAFPFDGTVIAGRDDITATATHFTLDCKVFGNIDGDKGFTMWYNGKVRLSETIGALLQGKSKETSFEETYIVNSMAITLDKDVDAKYRWVENTVLVGRGRFFRSDAGTLNIEYIVHAVQA